VSEPDLFRVIVELKDYSTVVTEPTTLDGATAELERLREQTRTPEHRKHMVRVGARALVLGSDIHTARIVKAFEPAGDEDD
jgi:hypothetical protein